MSKAKTISGSRRLLLTSRNGRPAILVKGAAGPAMARAFHIAAALLVLVAAIPESALSEARDRAVRILFFEGATMALALVGISEVVGLVMRRLQVKKRPLLRRAIVLGGDVEGGVGYRAAANDGSIFVDGVPRRLDQSVLQIAPRLVAVPGTQYQPPRIEQHFLLQLSCPEASYTLEQFGARGDAVWVGREIAIALGITMPSEEVVLDDPDAFVLTTPVWWVAFLASIEIVTGIVLAVISFVPRTSPADIRIHPLVSAGLVLALHLVIVLLLWKHGDALWREPSRRAGTHPEG